MAEMSALLKALATSRPYRAFARRVVLPWALQGMRPAGEALEIGTGSGAMAAQLLSVFPELHIVATDYDPDMVATARQTLAPLAGLASVQRADAADPPFADGQFDLVVPFAMLHHVVDWEQAIADAVRVLRPGGRLVGYDVLDTVVSRLLHAGQDGGSRTLRPGHLERALARLPVTSVRARKTLGGLTVRFPVTKAA